MLSFNNAIAKESYSGLYIKITDAATAVKNNRRDDAKKLFSEIKEEFKKIKNSDSVQGKKVQELLNKEKNMLTEDDLRHVTAALLSFEKEQNNGSDRKSVV